MGVDVEAALHGVMSAGWSLRHSSAERKGGDVLMSMLARPQARC